MVLPSTYLVVVICRMTVGVGGTGIDDVVDLSESGVETLPFFSIERFPPPSQW
jgi:hypothetical protein